MNPIVICSPQLHVLQSPWFEDLQFNSLRYHTHKWKENNIELKSGNSPDWSSDCGQASHMCDGVAASLTKMTMVPLDSCRLPNFDANFRYDSLSFLLRLLPFYIMSFFFTFFLLSLSCMLRAPSSPFCTLDSSWERERERQRNASDSSCDSLWVEWKK